MEEQIKVNELLIKRIQTLQDFIQKHNEIFAKIIERLEKVEQEHES